MASNHRQVQFLAAAVIAAIVFQLPALASAKDHDVGGGAGWTLNYPIGWPVNETFKVGDNLVFHYTKGNHTVTEVDGQTFRECYRQGNTINEWTSGHDTVKLDKPGRRWFFCSLADHCELGLKLVVNVVAAPDGPSPAPAPASPPPGPQVPSPASPSAPASPTDSTSSSSSSAASMNHVTAGEAVVRVVVVMVGAAVAGCFI